MKRHGLAAAGMVIAAMVVGAAAGEAQPGGGEGASAPESPGCTIVSWASIQTHGEFGELAIPLDDSFSPTVECRFTTVQHLIRVELTSPDEAPVVTGTVQAVDQNTGATFDAISFVLDNGDGTYTLDLYFIPPLPGPSPFVFPDDNVGCYAIDLAPNLTCLTGDTDMQFRVLMGNVRNDGFTNLSDFVLVKFRIIAFGSGTPFNPGDVNDIRKDISLDGRFMLNDLVLTKIQVQSAGNRVTCP